MYSFVQRNAAAGNAVTLASVGAGHAVVVFSAAYGAAFPTCTVSDGTNTLIKTPFSPSKSLNSPSRAWCIAYITNESAGSKTFTVTWGGFGITTRATFAHEYAYTGTPAFDAEVYFSAASSATPITMPSLTPVRAGQLLIFAASPTGSITAANSPWTAGGASAVGMIDGYIASSSAGVTAANFTDTTNPDEWYSFIVAFK